MTQQSDAVAMLRAGCSFQEAAESTGMDVWEIFAAWCGEQQEEIGKLCKQLKGEAK